MKQYDIALTAEGLTAYAIEQQSGWERYQPQGKSSWAESRRFWTDAILQGMARLEGSAPDPKLMEQYDQHLKEAQGCAAVETLSPAAQNKLIQSLRNYVSALEDAGGDRRQQVNVVRELLEDMAAHRPWMGNKSIAPAYDAAERTLQRMTAKLPIRFTRILLGGDSGPHWGSGFASGSVTDAEAVKQTTIYQELAGRFPEVTSWPALCTVYHGGNLHPASEAVDASAFDLEIMNRAGEQFLNERSVRWAYASYQMTISTVPDQTQVSESLAVEHNTPLQGGRPLRPDDLSIFELYSTEDDCLTFCLDVTADEETVFGRQLSCEQEDSYIVTYAVYDEAAGQVCDTLDVELRLPHDEAWFHCKLSPEVRESLKQKMDAFCVELYGEHLPEPRTQYQDESTPSEMGPTM